VFRELIQVSGRMHGCEFVLDDRRARFAAIQALSRFGRIAGWPQSVCWCIELSTDASVAGSQPR